MSARYDHYWRLEPNPQRRSFAAGFAAAIHDPVWFLARQWQMGEHQGENASSPVLIQFGAIHTPIQPSPQAPSLDPKIMPAEAIVEAEPDDWWTIGRRVRIGAIVAQRERANPNLDPAAVDGAYLLALPPPPFDRLGGRLPPPYERLAGSFDGLALWRNRSILGIGDKSFDGLGIPEPRAFFWQSDELMYEADFPIGDPANDRTLRLARHSGGRVDWFSADAHAPADAPAFVPEGEIVDTTSYPTAVQYPGAPHSRWWEIEDAAVDIGGYPPDTSHFATTLLIDLIASHGDDWFVFPVDARVGHALTINAPTVTDAFGEQYVLIPPADWWLFRTTDFDNRSLVVWLRALAPVEGRPIENVLLGLDEYSNILWAVERRIAGHDLSQPERTPQEELANPTMTKPDRTGEPDDRKRFVYVPGQDAAAYWHPYQIEDLPNPEGHLRRRFVQRRLADLNHVHPELLPAPRAEVLRVENSFGQEIVHEIMPATIPSIGIILERRYVLARDLDGNPVLWLQRQRTPFLSPPGRTLRFDVLAERAP
jgi:hypothetical protein